MKHEEPVTDNYYLPDEQKIMSMTEDIKGDQPHNSTPVRIDLSDFKKQKPSLGYRAAVILFVSFVIVCIASVILFIRSKMTDIEKQQNSWTSDYTLGGSSQSGTYKVTGCRNGDGCIEILLEQLSDDAELHPKVTAVFYKGSSAIGAQTGTGNLHGKGTSCIIEIPVTGIGFDSITLVSEE